MGTYDYECTACGTINALETNRPPSGAALTMCKKCKTTQWMKQIGQW